MARPPSAGAPTARPAAPPARPAPSALPRAARPATSVAPAVRPATSATLAVRPAAPAASRFAPAARASAPRAARRSRFAPALALAAPVALGGLAAGCGSDPAPPPPPPVVTLAAEPTPSWLCPGAQAPAFRVLARNLPDRAVETPGDPNAVGLSRRVVVSIDARATDERSGNEVEFATTGRCVGGSVLCGYLDVSVVDGSGAPTAPPQRFGSPRFELAVGEAPGPRRVRFELRDESDEPFFDPSGAPVAFDLSLEVVVAGATDAAAEACAPGAAETAAAPDGGETRPAGR